MKKVTVALRKKQEIAEKILGEITWDDTVGTAECPGANDHGNDGTTCKVYLNYDAPTISCLHRSCARAVEDANFRLRSEIGKLEHPRFRTPDEIRLEDNKVAARKALAKIRDACILMTEPADVANYVKGRIVCKETAHLFSYIPEGRLEQVLSPTEIELTGLRSHVGRIILWYLRHGNPVYYVSRSVHEKGFKKAYLGNGILEHPIWNIDDLYTKPTAVWGEGMFDCASLIALDYGCAGEITCNPIRAHLPELLIALRWRHKHHPDWRFIICLDNDEPTKDGVRPGNEAAEDLAFYLWSQGLDVEWVKHDPAATKVDINLMHQQGRVAEIHAMIKTAKHISELIPHDGDMARRNVIRCLAHHDYAGTERILNLIQQNEQSPAGAATKHLSTIIEEAFAIRTDYRELYEGIELFAFGDDYYVVHDTDYYGLNKKNYDVFTKTALPDMIKRFAYNPGLDVVTRMLDIPARRPMWEITREPNPEHGNEFNLFKPAPYFLQNPQKDAPLPPMTSHLLDNLAGAEEKEWLLNHMATWVQTLKKPITVPVLLGCQGSGKNTLLEMLGTGVGSYISIGPELFEENFNEWMMRAVVLLDELASTDSEAKKMKSKTKALINESQTINVKFERLLTIRHNGYIAVASNEQVTAAPVIIEQGDRRYTVITNGQDKNLLKQCADWFDREKLMEEIPTFMLYLLSRPINEAKARIPLDNKKKEELAALTEEAIVSATKEWVGTHTISPPQEPRNAPSTTAIAKAMKEDGLVNYVPHARKLAPVLRSLGVIEAHYNNQSVWTSVTLTPDVSQNNGPEWNSIVTEASKV
jgi:hypothetical protein